MRLRIHIPLLLLLSCLLAYPAIAESISCEDMPCCAATVQPVSTDNDCCEVEGSSEIASESMSMLDCSCTLNGSGPPSPSQQKTAVFFQQNLEIESTEVVLLIFDEEPPVAVEEKPVWDVEHTIGLKSQDVSLYAAFPNPPPFCS